jgi:tRNA A37 methylthiotransferase MiaB
MGRRGSGEVYAAFWEEIRQTLPGAVIRTTLMTGFPGEGRRDFKALLEFQEKARPDWLGAFVWSREEGVPAWHYTGGLAYPWLQWKGQRRRDFLLRRQQEISRRAMEGFAGRELEVLVEEAVEEGRLYLGRAYLQAPEVDGLTVIKTGRPLEPGEFVRVRVERASGLDLEAAAL